MDTDVPGSVNRSPRLRQSPAGRDKPVPYGRSE